MDAVAEVANRPYNTLASNDINNAITTKTNQYPGKISEEQHRAHAYVPVGVAALLREYPTLIGPCVRAFSKRDYLDNKVLRVMKQFPPEQRVLTDVRFSKGQYSDISRQSYQPDRKTGWNLPPSNHPSYASHILGVKLACGFEILVSSAGGLTPTTPSDNTEDFSEVKSNPKWIKYKQSLSEKGYFRNELEGSQLYQELEKNAQRFFVSTVAANKKGSEDELSMGTVIVNLLSKLNVDYDFFKKKEKELAPPDDENWLIKSPEMFDEMVESRYGKMPKATSEKEMMDSLSSFLTHMSDMTGAEIPPELQEVPKKPVRKHSRKASGVSIPSRKVSGQMRKISAQSNASDRSNASEMSSFSNKIDMNSEAFSECFKNMIELEVPEDKYFRDSDDDSSGMSSYDEEDTDISLSRKTSGGSSGVGSDMDRKSFDSDMKKYMDQMDEELKTSTVAEHIAPKIPLADLDDEFDEDLAEDIADLKSVKDLITAYHEQGGDPGPASTLFNAMGIRPQ